MPKPQSTAQLREATSKAVEELQGFRPAGGSILQVPSAPAFKDPVFGRDDAAHIVGETNNNESFDDLLDIINQDMGGGPQSLGSGSVVWYQKKCERCDFVTMRSNDVHAMEAIVKEMEQHLRDQHPTKGPNETFSAARAAYVEATKLTEVEAGVDNRSSILHPMRTRPGVIDHRALIKMQPMIQEHVYCYPDMGYIGLHIANPKIVDQLHDRSDPNLILEKFSPGNLSTRMKDTRGSSSMNNYGNVEEEWANFANIGDAVLAVDQYDCINRWIHPGDWGSNALRRFVLVKAMKGLITDTKHISSLFRIVTTENANRVARKELPLTFDEIKPKWDEAINGAGVSSEASLWNTVRGLERVFKEFQDQNKKQKRGFDSMAAHQGPQGVGVGGAPKQKKPKKGNSGYCLEFNSPAGCKNEPSPSGCFKNGREMRHGCSFVLATGKYCNNPAHTRSNHV